jgi:hypothetical protein
VPDRLQHDVEHHLQLSADEVGNRGRPAAIVHLDKINSGHHFEELSGNVLRAPQAALRVARY